MKETILRAIDGQAARLAGLARFIGSNPELGHEEFQAVDRLTEELRQAGFRVRRPVLDIATAFIAEFDSGKPGPTVGFVCEYDALPDIGHACGHHLISAMSFGAALGYQAAIDRIGGIVRVYGTPAEETKGAKVPMAAEGLFDDCDFVLMGHPYHSHEASGSSLAMDAIEYRFFGKEAHAAASPHEGVNALDAVLLLFHAVSALRQQLPTHVRLHGIINNGGKAANIIPGFASARFYLRSASRACTDELAAKVLRCAEGAALQTGCRMEAEPYEYSYDELRTNRALSEVYARNLTSLGVDQAEIRTGNDHGSLDLGNVSLRCPVIHPFVRVTDEIHELHTVEFRDAAMRDRAVEGMLLGAKALACTAAEAASDPAILRRIREEFERSRKPGEAG